MNSEPRYNAMRQLEVADGLAKLWTGLLPDHEAPGRSQFLQWAAMASETIVVRALNRAARKALREGMDADRVGRYITSVVRNERDGAGMAA